ncbi:MAG: hypothetical protein OFPII_30400 [Osedax symbiont Rs1]|nr:MAG: hypothetical protein OFPII_30400 [Osedax symbiont Rs1]
MFTQAENEAQESWYFYQQSAAIIIRSQLDIDALFKHLRKFTRIYNPQTDTWLQYHFYAPYWIEDMLHCMTPGQLSKFWGKAIDHIIALKPLKKSVSVISCKAQLNKEKPSKIELTERMSNALEQCKTERFIQEIITWISQNEQIHPDLNTENLVDIMTEQASLLRELNINSQVAITKLLSAVYRTNLVVTQWGDEIKQFLLDAEMSQDMKADQVVIALNHYIKSSGEL